MNNYTTVNKLLYNIIHFNLYVDLEDFEMVSIFSLRIENSINTLLRDIYLLDNRNCARVYKKVIINEYICPNAEWCTAKICNHRLPHTHTETCDANCLIFDTGPCIKYKK